jgi:hypothetical protein
MGRPPLALLAIGAAIPTKQDTHRHIMPSTIHVAICAVAALAYWGIVGLALSRRLAPSPLALPLAPALGWACHSALTLPLYRFLGFTEWTVSIVSLLILAAACLLLLSPASDEKRDSGVRVPLWAYGLAAVLAAVPAVAPFPKFSGDAVMLAGPIFDHSKVAIIDEMTRLGLPPGNPFFAEGGQQTPLAYYYLWHFSAAELALAFGVSGWEADIVMTGVTAFSSLALMMGFAAWIGRRGAAAAWVVPLAFAASLYPVLRTIFGANALYSVISPPTGFAGWLFQTSWAPQHTASAACVLLSSFLLMQLARRPSVLTAAVLALVTAAGYESSTWVGGILFAIAAPVMALILLTDAPPAARMRFIVWSLAAALVTAALAYPFLHDQFLNAARRGVGSPIAFEPYSVFALDVSDTLLALMNLPGYWLIQLVIEFPAIYITGAMSLIGSLRSKPANGPPLLATKVFCGLAFVSLLIAGTLTITFADNNDLGWRSVLPAVFILTIFAATGLSRWSEAPAPFALAGALFLLALGLPRAIQLTAENIRGLPNQTGEVFAASPEMWSAVRQHAAPDERVANNPLFLQDMTPWPVNVSWALFGNRPSCFAGRELALPYTALPRIRLAGIEAQFNRVFAGKEQPGDVRAMAIRYQCRVVVVTSQDGAWTHDPFAGSPYYKLVDERGDAWRIYRVTEAGLQATAPGDR